MSDAGSTLNHHNNTSLIHLGGIIFLPSSGLE